MTALITEFDPFTSFVDEQIRGPFKYWRHEHSFESDGRGGTVMHDSIDFAAPLGPVGTIVELGILNRYLPKLIRHRNEHIKASIQMRWELQDLKTELPSSYGDSPECSLRLEGTQNYADPDPQPDLRET
ncbi:SRPBCC family protein [Sinomonas mesophila]|uniref:SRPBCC family protein n=1 Tax=Sinomonas mesophila TaxID=1531955 RepID=UPI001C3782C9|nr:SRPBCC family protein [Sinomonas mesophila]